MDNIHAKSMKNKLVIGFIVIGFLSFFYRVLFYSPESVPTGDSVWELSMTVSILSGDNYPTIYMAVPIDSASNRVISQTFIHPGFNLKRLTQRKNVAAREVIAIARDKGKLTLTGEYKIQISGTKRWQEWLKPANILIPEERMQYLELPTELQLDDGILNKILKYQEISTQDQAFLLEEIFKYTNQKILSDKTAVFESLDKTLTQKRADALGKANVMVALCRVSNIPARLVTGVVVKEMLGAKEHYWVEVYSDDMWKSYDPSAGYSGEVPATYLKLKESSAQLAYQKDGLPLEVVIDIEQIPTPAGLMGTGQKRFRDIFDLVRLPVSTQFLLSSLLLLPFGALVTVIFRRVIGVQTFGTFTPSLLALSMIYADLITVVVVVSLVTFIGVGGRSLLPQKMSRVPRLSVVLTIVAIAMVFSVSLMDYYNLNPSPSVVLLPIIVMVSLIDRVYAVTDEKGLAVSIYRLIWTCLVAGICYMVFSIEVLRPYLLIYPEIHFFTLSMILILSAYKWKTLTNIPLFHWLQEPKPSHNLKEDSQESEKVKIPE